jgi:hypothetical protein
MRTAHYAIAGRVRSPVADVVVTDLADLPEHLERFLGLA